jgi:AAA15 family ATPase/GTPase
MLIRLCLENMWCFKEPIEFSMVASPKRLHSHHVFRSQKQRGTRLVRFAALYGANAAGKSNLVKALQFAQNLITIGVRPEELIPIQRFRLDQNCLEKPARFQVEFLVQAKLYEYGFEVDPDRIHREWLLTFTRQSDTLLFERTTNQAGETHIKFGEFWQKLDLEEQQFLQFLGRGTRANQLYLRESIERNANQFEDAYSWFSSVLNIIKPDETYLSRLELEEDLSFQDFFAAALQAADTGITGIAMQEVDPTHPDIPFGLIVNARRFLKYTDKVYAKAPKGDRFTIIQDHDKIRLFKLITIHSTSDERHQVDFELEEESDGTRRLIDLIPVLGELIATEEEAVFVIDEIDRSLHSQLSRMIIDLHLAKEHQSRPSQLIVTTHETHLLDLDLLRRDEIWFIEKNSKTGIANLYSLYDFQAIDDKDILKDYLRGRYGGIPFLGNVYSSLPRAIDPSDPGTEPEESENHNG